MNPEQRHRGRQRLLAWLMALLTTGLLPAAAMGSDCTITAIGSLDFGTIYLPVAGSTYADTEIIVSCTPGVPYAIEIDGGNNFAGSTRNMSAGAGRLLPYQLFRDASRSKPWGNNTPWLGQKKSVAGSGTEKYHTVFGEVIPAEQTEAGRYTDTVIITVSW